MTAKPQNLANHVRVVPAYHLALTLLLAVNLAYWVYAASRHFGLESLVGMSTSVALFLLFVYVRVFPLTVQDRVIRLEMRLRLERLLPAEQMKRFDGIEPQQLVALRFAGDAELPGLVQRVLAGELKTSAEIKREIKDWQADWLRV
jgi:hypothetical protein